MNMCKQCDAGKYQTGFGVSSSIECISCPDGKFQTGTGSSHCTLCDFGKYQTGLGMKFSINCSSCTPGKYQRVQGVPCETNGDLSNYLGLGIGLGLVLVFISAAVFGYYWFKKAHNEKKVIYDSIESQVTVEDSRIISVELFTEQGGLLDLGSIPDFASRLSPLTGAQAELCFVSDCDQHGRKHGSIAAT
jgi:hypothetical protein